MRIEEIMTRNPEYVRPGATLREAADKMLRHDTGVLPVSDGQELYGLLTDRDIVVRGVARALDPATATVDQVATKNPSRCGPDADIDECVQLMKEKQVRRIPVVNDHGDLVGMVSLADVAREVKTKQAGDVLEKVSQPS